MFRSLLFGLAVAFTLAPRVMAQTATIQAVHASAALASLGPIEVYINQDPTSTTPDAEVTFLSGTAFLSVPSGQPFTVRARLKNPPPSGLPRESSFTAPSLAAGQYVISLVGIPSQVQAFFARNPDGVSRDLALVEASLVASSGRLGGGVPVVVTNAVTDAPALTVTVRETGAALATALPYGQAAPPIALAPGTYTVDVERTSDGEVLATRLFTVVSGEPSAAFVVAGFLNPAANQNGPPLTVAAVTETGASNPGSPVASENDLALVHFTVGPNPTASSVVVRYTLRESGPVRLSVLDLLGREVAVLTDSPSAAGLYTTLVDATSWAPGRYVVRLSNARRDRTAWLTIVR